MLIGRGGIGRSQPGGRDVCTLLELMDGGWDDDTMGDVEKVKGKWRLAITIPQNILLTLQTSNGWLDDENKPDTFCYFLYQTSPTCFCKSDALKFPMALKLLLYIPPCIITHKPTLAAFMTCTLVTFSNLFSSKTQI